MSDIDRTRMIPLHIADQAVAACDAEIAKLREENARLKAEVNELADGLKLASEVGIKMADEVTRLKAEVQRLTKAGDEMDDYLKRQDGTTNGMLDCRLQWHAAKEGKGHA
jgi:cell division protein FtsB